MARKPKEIPIDDSPFFKSLRKRSKKLYLTKGGKVRRKVNVKETYQRDVLEICLRMSALLETLRLSRFFLDERRNVPADNGFKIKNAAFIRYHIECYFIRITTFKDLILKLIRRVHQFEIKENIGLEGNIKKKAERDNFHDITSLLEGLNILMKNIEPIRHKIAHGGYHDNIDLILIETEEVIRNDNVSSSLTNNQYNLALSRLLTQNIIDMHMIEVMMATFILVVYKKLYPIRRIREKEFETKTTTTNIVSQSKY